MDYRNDSNLSNKNTIIYGHSMKNGSMFATLINYRKQDFYDNHKNVYYCTKEKTYKVELFAGLTVNDDYEIYNLVNLDENRINNLKNKSDFKSNVIVTSEDKIITLSTCAYEYQNARYIVMGILK
jgi:sortase B